MRSSWITFAVPLGAAAALVLASAPLRAGTEADKPATADATGQAAETPPPSPDAERYPARSSIRALIEKETAKTGLPADIAEAVVFVESRYDSSVVGRVGEIGLMQVRPETAAMLGFTGTNAELAKPETNIHYGVAYLSRAWRLAQGDLCRALMKYRAGHGEEIMSVRSVIYCNRARGRLIAMNSPFATPDAGTAALAAAMPDPAPAKAVKPEVQRAPRPTDAYAGYAHGTPAASRAFWAAHEARVRAINARIEAKWHRVASR